LKRRRQRAKRKSPPEEGGRGTDAGQGFSGQGSPRSNRAGRPLIRDDAGYLGAVIVLVALAAVILRTIYLSSDPPVGLSWSQALFTDGARAIDGARNKIEYGEWMVDKVSPVLLFYPISNLLAYVVYKLGGVGLVQANLTGVLPGLVALAFAYCFMRRAGGRVAAGVVLAVFALPYVNVIYTRTPLLEPMQILLLVGAFWAVLRGGRAGYAISGFLVGLAAFMVKLHALHFAAVAVVFLLFMVGTGRESRSRAYGLGAFFFAGLAAAVLVWLLGVYSVDPAAVAEYFRSNILVTQTSDYTNASLLDIVANRIRQFLHVGSGMDMFFHEAPVLSVLAALGLLSALSGFARGNASLRNWEMLAAVWFAVLAAALSLLGYRPLRYFIPLVPAMSLLASSVIIRLLRREPLLHENKPRWFLAAFFIWLVWVLVHVQHDIIFLTLRPHLGGNLTAGQQSLARYDQAIAPQLLIMGGVSAGLLLVFGKSLRRASWTFGRAASRNLAIIAFGAVVVLNVAKFADYCAGRKYSIVETAKSLERVTSPGVFLVGDCATTLSLEAGFKTLPSYGELIRRDDREAFERYPVTHFLIRFPTLYEYLDKNYPDFKTDYSPVDRYMLCGREATVIRYEAWPGYPASYKPSDFEEAMSFLARGEVVNASGLFRSFLDEHPDSYEAMFGLAICLSMSGSIDEARSMLEEGIRIAPADALSYHVYKDLLQALLEEGGAGR
jgi:4-amino-4-deoxy-L-arabinose transferase-like glycosyltransferase